MGHTLCSCSVIVSESLHYSASDVRQNHRRSVVRLSQRHCVAAIPKPATSGFIHYYFSLLFHHTSRPNTAVQRVLTLMPHFSCDYSGGKIVYCWELCQQSERQGRDVKGSEGILGSRCQIWFFLKKSTTINQWWLVNFYLFFFFWSLNFNVLDWSTLIWQFITTRNKLTKNQEHALFSFK